MRHRVHDKKFNRDANERQALFKSLLRALTEQGQIVTTQARAKVLKQMADKLVGQAQVNTLASRRELHKVFGKRDVVNTLVDSVAPAMTDRVSGFVRLTPMGKRRGDNTPMMKVEFVKQSEHKGLKNARKTEPQAKSKVTEKPAAKTVAKAAPKVTTTSKATAPIKPTKVSAKQKVEPQLKKVRKPTI